MDRRLTRREALAMGVAAAPAAPAGTNMSELCFLPATEIARRLRRRQVSAREVLEAHLKQIDRVNPKVNAIVTLVAEQAMVRAKQADEGAAKGRFLGPLHGLPIAHKDLLDTKGIRTTYGSPIFRDHVPEADALLVERIREAGAILIGKTNTPEFGAGSQTFNPVFGSTRNPYDLAKTCGGSSGGAAVALACGMLPIADGSDMGGSLRNPASFCSVVGFRTSPGRVPIVPARSSWQPLSVLGPMGRNVADVALLLSAMAGPDPRSPLSLDDPGSRFAAPLGRDFKGVRVAWCGELAGAVFEKRVLNVFQRQRKTFESIGCVVEEAQPDLAGVDEIFRTRRAMGFFATYGGLLARHRHEMKDTVVEEIERGARLTVADLVRAELEWTRLLERVGGFMTKYEYFVLPTTQVAPFDVKLPYPAEIDGVKMRSYIDWMRSCYHVTLTALPAISVPAGFTSEGLPVGIQIVGRHHGDWSVLQIARAFEQASGISPRVPPAV
jgi:amidase